MVMPGRSFSSDTYRYGFNGKEKDDDIYGEGNAYDFGARIQDPRLSRFLSIDPDYKIYPYLSPYLFALDNPLRMIDFNGEGAKDRVQAAREIVRQSNLGKIKYQARNDNLPELQTANSKEALAGMNCTEFVLRVLAADGITGYDKNSQPIICDYNVQELQDKLLKDTKKFQGSSSPEVGDVFIQNYTDPDGNAVAHVAIVTWVSEDKKTFRLAHASGSRTGIVETEKKYSTDEEVKKSKRGKGSTNMFYRPKSETNDGKTALPFLVNDNKNNKTTVTPKSTGGNSTTIEPGTTLEPAKKKEK